MPPSGFDSTELPALQPRTHCVLIPRDPDFIYAYWNYTEEDINRLRDQLKFESGDSQLILRVYDITHIKFNGSNANHTWDIDVGFSSKNFYVHVWQDNADYCVELGLRYGENHFIPLTRSDIVHVPPKTSSKRDDLIWQDIKTHKESKPYIKENIKDRYQGLIKKHSKQKFHAVKQAQQARTYQLTPQDIRAYYTEVFYGVSKKGRGDMASLENIIKSKWKNISWQKTRPFMTMPDLIRSAHPGASGGILEKGAGEDHVSSRGGASEGLPGFPAGASEGRLNKREFFFEIWTELIVHGRTEPDAVVWLNRQGITLNPDGTFSLRYALPDGEIPLKFIAQSSDGIEQRHISTGVEREKTIAFPRMLKGFDA